MARGRNFFIHISVYVTHILEYFPYPLRKNNKQVIKVKMSNKRNAEEMGADVEDTREIKKKCVGIENLVFLFFTAASCVDFVRVVTFAIQKYVHQKKPMQSEQRRHNLQTNWTGLQKSLCQFNLPVYSDACKF